MVKVEHQIIKDGDKEVIAFKFEGQTSQDTETLDFLSELFFNTQGAKQGFTKYNRLIVQVNMEKAPTQSSEKTSSTQ